MIEQGGVSGSIISSIASAKVNSAMPKGFFDVVIPETPDEVVPPEMLPPEYTPYKHEE